MPRVVCPMCRTGFEASINRDNFALNCVSCGVAFSAASFLWKDDASAGAESSEASVFTSNLPAEPAENETGRAVLAENPVSAGVSAASAAAIVKPNEPCPRFVPLPTRKAVPVNDDSSFAKPASHQTRTGGLPFMSDSDEHEKVPESNAPAPASAILNSDKRKDEGTNLQSLRDKLNNIRVKLSEGQSRKELNGGLDSDKAALENVPEIKLDQSADECPTPLPAKAVIKLVTPDVPSAVPMKLVASKPAEPNPLPHKIEEAKAVQPPVAAVVAEDPKKVPEEKTKKKSRRPLLEGSFGPYDIEGEIARGGVGAVFRARERATGREIALKVLLDGEEAGETERERFRHECETAKALSLPGMVQVYEVGELEQRPYMAMELVNGRSLDKVIPEKTLTVNDCLILMKSVAETIAALHEAGYVHRDLKPGNILIDAFGTPKVADFGLVKSLDEITRMTASGLVCGTPAYMSPEQARGDGKAIDPRSDVWALGAVLYEMLTTRPPFQAENALRLMLKITKDNPKPPRMLNLKVPQDVHFIVMKCLEKNPEKRYATARTLAIDIARFLNGEPLEASSQPKFKQVFAAFTDNKRRVLTLAITVAVMVTGAYLGRKYFAPKDPNSLVDQGARTLSDPELKFNERIDLAEKSFRDAIAMDPKNARAYRMLGLCLGRRGIDGQGRVVDPARVAEAKTSTLKAAELDPQMYGDCRAQLARFCLWAKHPAEESREWEKAVEFAPGNLKYRVALAMAYWNTGAMYNSTQHYNRALLEFKAIAKIDPSYPRLGEYIQQLQERFLAQPQVADSAVVPSVHRR